MEEARWHEEALDCLQTHLSALTCKSGCVKNAWHSEELSGYGCGSIGIMFAWHAIGPTFHPGVFE